MLVVGAETRAAPGEGAAPQALEAGRVESVDHAGPASGRHVVPPPQEESFLRVPSLAVALPVGAGIGFLSGVIGVGGGIFLSPLLILLKWADAKRTAAASAAFIWVNSAAGLYGHLLRKTVDWSALGVLVGVAFAGGFVGSYLGARRFRGVWLRRTLGVVLVIATVKLLRTAF